MRPAIVRIPCVMCDLFGHDPQIRLCSLCRLEVAKQLKRGHTTRQIGGDNWPLVLETRKLATALAVAETKTASLPRSTTSNSLRPLPREVQHDQR